MRVTMSVGRVKGGYGMYGGVVPSDVMVLSVSHQPRFKSRGIRFAPLIRFNRLRISFKANAGE